MHNFKHIVESYIQDMERVDPGEWEGEVTAEDFLANFDRDEESLEFSMIQLVSYGAGKFPAELASMFALDDQDEMAQHVRDNWES